MNPKTTRNPFYDILKAIAILLVVMGHVIQTFHPDFKNSGLEMGIIMFHMPLFMAVSGFFFAKSIEKTKASALIKKRAIQLLLPSLTMGLIGVLEIGGVNY